MDTPSAPTTKNHRVPVEMISHAVWRDCRFWLSFGDGEEFLRKRGSRVTSEAIRKWGQQWGQHYATELRRPRPGDPWHLDELGLTIKGNPAYLWRAVEQAGTGLDPGEWPGFLDSIGKRLS